MAPLHLAYEVVGTTDGCPDETAFRRDVALRLGVDPFVTSGVHAERTLRILVERDTRRAVTVMLVDEREKILGRREITEPRTSCAELVANAAFAASVAIDPTVLSRSDESRAPAPPPPSPPPPGPTPAPSAAPRDAGAAPQERPRARPTLTARARADGLAAVGVLPTTALGAGAGLAIGTSAFDLGAEFVGLAGGDTSLDVPTGNGSRVALSTSLLGGDVHACVHLRKVVSPYACGAVFAGVLRSRAAGIATPRDAASAWIALAPRLGLEIPLTTILAVDLRVDVPLPLTVADLRVDDRSVWTSNAVAVVAGAGASLSLW